MKVDALNTLLQENGLAPYRYICHDITTNTWLVLVTNTKHDEKAYAACLELDEAVYDAPYVLELTHVEECFTKSDDYDIVLVGSLVRQVDRFLGNCAIVSSNLICFKSPSGKFTAWAKGLIDSPKIYTILTLSSSINKDTLIWDKARALDRVLALATRYWEDDELDKSASRMFSKIKHRKNVAAREDSLLQNEHVEAELLTCERSIFDASLFGILRTHALHTCKSMINVPI